MLRGPWGVTVMAPGTLDEPEKHALTTTMLRIVFPFLLFISMTSLAGAVLNSFRQFALPALNPVLFNLTTIAAMLWLAPYFTVQPMALAWGVLIGGRSEEHTSELQSLMRISYAVFCLKKKNETTS